MPLIGSLIIKKWHQHNSAQPLNTMYFLLSLTRGIIKLGAVDLIIWLYRKHTNLAAYSKRTYTWKYVLLNMSLKWTRTFTPLQANKTKYINKALGFVGHPCWRYTGGCYVHTHHLLSSVREWLIFPPFRRYVNDHTGQVPLFSHS